MEDDSEDLDKQTALDEEEGTPDDFATENNFEEEADVARKVLNNLLSLSAKGTTPPSIDNSEPPDTMKGLSPTEMHELSIKPDDSEHDSVVRSHKSTKSEVKESKEIDGVDDLQRTIFISNLPFDADAEEVKERFSAFGVVLSFVPVLHKVTRYDYNLLISSQLY